jgi:flagellar biosynthetic protein FlhB
MADQKTEKATPQRLKKAREDGNFPVSRSFVSALQFAAFVAMISSWGPAWAQKLSLGFQEILRKEMDPRIAPMDTIYAGIGFVIESLKPVCILGGILILITLAVQLGVTGFGFSLKKLTPDFSRLSPVSKLQHMPMENLQNTLQAAVMIPVFGVVVYYLIAGKLEEFLTLPLRDLASGTLYLVSSLESLLWKAAGLFVVFGLIDLIKTKSKYDSEMKMSKQDIKDEHKDSEGSPLMKQRVRRIARDMARKRMMQEVPTATAVIVNPTHYAVAIRYSMENKGAPRVVAKGKNYLALRIKQKAIDNQVPIIENVPLAQALYKSVDVGQEIPAEFYKAVAEVLAYIFRIMNGRRTA